jgi:two-component system, sensor histidine kinase and response regulator
MQMRQKRERAQANRRWQGAAMTEPRDPSSRLAVNLPELLGRLDDDRDLLQELIGIFKQEFPRLLQVLQEAVARGDARSVEVTSHAMRGMLSGLSVTRAAAIASRLENMAREGKMPALPAALALFEREVADLLPELDSYTTR